MLDSLFLGLFNPTQTMNITISDFFICVITAIILGLIMSKMYSYKTKCTKGFVISLAVLPMTIAIVIMMVNGNVGAGVAVAGAFSLVRFRSVPGTSKEISALFTAMCTGLTIGMGYIGFSVLFAIIASLFAMILNSSDFGSPKNNIRILHITIPENLNYTDVFNDLFEKYTKNTDLLLAKTANMGSLFKLSYEIELKDIGSEKDLIDELRCRNGNLEIIITKQDSFLNGL